MGWMKNAESCIVGVNYQICKEHLDLDWSKFSFIITFWSLLYMLLDVAPLSAPCSALIRLCKHIFMLLTIMICKVHITGQQIR